MATMVSGLLITGQPLMFTKELAVKTSVHLAVFLQQTHFMISRYGKEDSDGVRWLRWPHDKWHTKVFPFWGPATLRRFMYEAIEKGWLLSKAEPGATPKYAIDYDRLEAEFTRGRVIKTISPQGDQNEHPQGDQNGHPVPCIERDTEKRVKRETSGKLRLPPVKSEVRKRTSLMFSPKKIVKSTGEKKKLPSAEDLKRTSRENHHVSNAANLSDRPTTERLITFWKTTLADYGISSLTLSFTGKERGMIRNLVKQFSESCNGSAGNKLGIFLEFAVQNWAALRKKIVWETNGKPRLHSIPNISEVFYNRQDILHYMENTKGVVKDETKKEIYTDVSMVPKDHPKYREIVLAIKTIGQAVLS
jgi:hypothetical protein